MKPSEFMIANKKNCTELCLLCFILNKFLKICNKLNILLQILWKKLKMTENYSHMSLIYLNMLKGVALEPEIKKTHTELLQKALGLIKNILDKKLPLLTTLVSKDSTDMECEKFCKHREQFLSRYANNFFISTTNTNRLNILEDIIQNEVGESIRSKILEDLESRDRIESFLQTLPISVLEFLEKRILASTSSDSDEFELIEEKLYCSFDALPKNIAAKFKKYIDSSCRDEYWHCQDIKVLKWKWNDHTLLDIRIVPPDGHEYGAIWDKDIMVALNYDDDCDYKLSNMNKGNEKFNDNLSRLVSLINLSFRTDLKDENNP